MRSATEADPTQAAPLSDWCADLQNRTPARGAPPCAWHTERQRRTPGRGALQAPERVGLRRKTGQRGLLIASYKRLEKRLGQGRNYSGGSPCPRTLSDARVPASQAAAPPSRSTLTGTELPQAKNVLRLCTQGRFGRVQLFATCWLWPARLLCQPSSPGKSAGTYWPVLAVVSCCPRHQPRWEPGAARALWPKQLHHLHTRRSQGPTQVLQGSLRSKPPWTTHVQREIKPPLNPRAVWPRKETPSLPASCMSWRLNPHK